MTDNQVTPSFTEDDPRLIWERVASNGWWRAYVATHRDEYGTPEDDEGNCLMGAGPTRQDALDRLNAQ